MKKQIKPTDSELEILQILWQHGPLPVRVVNEMLTTKSGEEIGYTTTLKLMQIMTDKNIRHLPVVDQGKVCGIISIGDVVRSIIEEQQNVIEHLEQYISGT